MAKLRSAEFSVEMRFARSQWGTEAQTWHGPWEDVLTAPEKYVPGVSFFDPLKIVGHPKPKSYDSPHFRAETLGPQKTHHQINHSPSDAKVWLAKGWMTPRAPEKNISFKHHGADMSCWAKKVMFKTTKKANRDGPAQTACN